MYNKTVLENVVDWLIETKGTVVNVASPLLYEIIASVVFLLMITRGRKTWMDCMHLFSFVEGIFYLAIPENSFGVWVTGVMTESHASLIRYMALVVITWALTYFLLRNSTDSTVQSSFMLSFLAMLVCNLMAMGYLMTHNQTKAKVKIEEKGLFLLFYMSLLGTVGTLFHTLFMRDWGGYGEIASHANLHTRLHFVLLLLSAVLSYALPSWCLKMAFPQVKSFDTVHVLVERGIGAIAFGMAFLVLRVPNFLRQNDKEAVLAAQWLMMVVTACYGVYQYITGWNIYTTGLIVVGVIFDLIVFANITGALDRDVSVFKRVVLPKFRAIPGDLKQFFKMKTM
ncbi:uncharacterized protein LOC127865601 [Dreissena polymorpha]|uniref:Uncharacterized protein n=1 Tax=Dreissena polymorpha TaxID=45954 RepID=A0A9D4RAD6_DREPO|nr:uncharacterized protein LOC127865601 [Dreissena polymorpha]KAH3860158.1 hypothetical protein DPMN_023049 [Dreissena polymorpha]